MFTQEYKKEIAAKPLKEVLKMIKAVHGAGYEREAYRLYAAWTIEEDYASHAAKCRWTRMFNAGVRTVEQFGLVFRN